MQKVFSILLAGILISSIIGCDKNYEESKHPIEHPIRLSAVELYENILKDITITDEIGELPPDGLEDLYVGLDKKMLTDSIVMLPLMSSQITEIAVFQVKDISNLETVKAAAEKRLDAIQNGGAFSPSQIEIANQGKVLSNQNYVVLIVDPEINRIVTNFNKLFK